MIYALPGQQVEAILEGAPTGLAGTIGVRVIDPPTGDVVIARTTDAIVEAPAGSGVYAVAFAAPPEAGQFLVVWDDVPGGEPLTPDHAWTEQLEVNAAGAPIAPPSLDAAYFTVAELREYGHDTRLADPEAVPDDELEEMRQTVEQSIEHVARVAFVPRLRTEALSGPGTTDLRVSQPRVRRVVSAAAAGQILDVTDVRVVGNRVFWRAGGWPAGRGNLSVTYEHGYDAPPARVKRAALVLAKNWLLVGPIDDRATQIPDGVGGAINRSTPGMFGAVFGIPEVDQVIGQPARRGGYQEPIPPGALHLTSWT